MTRLSVHVWSDIACPWCYVGKRRFEAALARFPERAQVDLRWRAFELDPRAPSERDPSQSYAERLAAKYRRPVAQAEEMIQAMTRTAAAEGLDFKFDRIRAGNTFDAHRLIHLAQERGLQGDAKERLLRAYFTEGRSPSDRETLVDLGVEIGLDRSEVAAMLASDHGAREVRADEAEAHQLGIQAVPFFVIGRHGVAGAQPADTLVRVLTEAWTEALPTGSVRP